MATVEIKFKELREAVATLNETDLIKEKIKLVGSPKEEILQQFMNIMCEIPDDEEGKFPGPKVCLDFYNKILDAEEKAVNTSEETPSPETSPQTEESKVKEPAKKQKVKETKGKSSGKKEFITGLIKEGKYTKKEIIQKTLAQFKDTKESSIVTMLSDGKNTKYNPFEKLIQIDEKGIISFVEAK